MPYRDKAVKQRYQKQYHRQKRLKLLDWLNGFKSRKKCEQCGISFKNNPEIGDFHHLDASLKDRRASSMAKLLVRYGMRFFLAEIKKCILLCANCHRIMEKKKPFSKGKSIPPQSP